jgi:wyosine [tRNA(Phe)-imidazoG37] synthetase (radical SAM superfamily)
LIFVNDNSSLREEQSRHPREFADLTYAYPVISRRSGGVSIGVNLNLDKACNFDCPYCQVDRTLAKAKLPIQVKTIRTEVGRLLDTVDATGICRLEKFSTVSDAAKRLKDVAISGDGEPTMVPEFPDVCEDLASLQAARPELDFKLVLITNSTLLDRPAVQKGISHLLSRRGEIWAKLDAGTEAWYQRVNVSRISLDRIEANLIALGRHHPFTVQTMFHGFDGALPPEGEVDAYLTRLKRIKASGARIDGVQLYTLARKPSQANCTPVPGPWLDALRTRITKEAGINAQVFGVPE